MSKLNHIRDIFNILNESFYKRIKPLESINLLKTMLH